MRLVAYSAVLLGITAGQLLAQEMSFTLGRVNNRTVVIATPVDTTRTHNVPVGATLTVVVTCAAEVDCATVGLGIAPANETAIVAPRTLSRTPAAGANAATVRAVFAADQLSARPSTALHISDGANRVMTPVGLLVAGAAPAGGAPPATGGTTTTTNPIPASLAALLTYDCGPVLNSTASSMPRYHADSNYAAFLVAANGNVWARPDVDLLDENDRIDVTVVAHPDLLPALRIRRISAFRAPGALNIVGADAKLPDLGGLKSARPQRPACESATIELGDFQPGRGEIGLFAQTDAGEARTGSFEFGVNTLYSGAFGLGAMRSELRDPAFGLVFNGTDSVVTEVSDRTPRTLYVLTYTPFVWGKRDLSKDVDLVSIDRINPILGIVLSDISNNFVGGFAYDLVSMVSVAAGWHLGRVRRLNPDSQLELGDPFTGNSTQIPVTRDWRHRAFVAATLDLRAATEFLRKAGAPTP